MTEPNSNLPSAPQTTIDKSTSDKSTPNKPTTDKSTTDKSDLAKSSGTSSDTVTADPETAAQESPDKTSPKSDTPKQLPPNQENTSHKAAKPSGTGQTPPRNPPPVKTSPGQSRFALFTALLSLMLVAAASLYFWQKQTQQTVRLEQLLNQSANQGQQLNTLQGNIQQKLGKLDEGLFEQQNRLSNLSQQAYFNTQKLADLGARSRMDWLLAEAEYLMRLANQRLSLEHDIQSAEAMLSSADSILAEINDPGLIEIRQTLASEVVSLQQVRHLDYQGLYLRLDALINSVDHLKQNAFAGNTNRDTDTSSASQISAADTQSNTSNSFMLLWQSIWQDLKQAVSIRRLDQPVPPLLAPEQHYYLTQNLRLMLEQASLALLDKDAQVYQSSLKKAASWLNQYFIQNDPQIQQIHHALNEMAQYEISVELPDISHSLRLTKAKIESFYRQHSLNKLSSPDTETAPAGPQKPESQQTPETQQAPASQNEGAVL